MAGPTNSMMPATGSVNTLQQGPNTGGQGTPAPSTTAIYPTIGGGQIPTLLPQGGTAGASHISTQATGGGGQMQPYATSGPSTTSGQTTANVTANADPSSPTGGYVNINPNVGEGVNTSPNALLPGGFTIGQTGVGQQSTTTANPSSYVSAGEQQMAGVTNWNVAPDQTVAGQYAALTGENGGQINPAIQQAEQASIRANAAHGGANDLMSQLGAQAAGSDLALKVATTDAATNAAAASYNAQAANAEAQNINQFVENAQLSSQNFNEGLATLNAQTNQQLDLVTANVNANAANTSIGLNANIANAQVSLNSTLAAMGQQYNYTTAENAQQAGIQNEQAWTNYGMQVRLNYLGSVQQQAGALQQEIANISSNPNITSAQAQGAMSDAINQFNTLVTSLGSYSAAMMPTPSTGTSSGTYNSPAYNYSYINAGSWPGTSTGGGSASSGFFLNPSALSSGQATGSVAPINNPYQTTSTGGGAQAAVGGGGSGGANNAGLYSSSGATTSYSGNSAGGLISGAQGTWSGQNLMLNGQSVGSPSEVGSLLTSIMDEIPSGVTNAASYITNAANQSTASKLILTALGLFGGPVGGAISTAVSIAKVINWLHNKYGNQIAPIPTGKGGAGSSGQSAAGDVGSYANSMGEWAGQTNNESTGGNISPLGGPNIFQDVPANSDQGQAAQQDQNSAPLAGELQGNFDNGSGSSWDGSFSGGEDFGGGGGASAMHMPGQVGGAEVE